MPEPAAMGLLTRRGVLLAAAATAGALLAACGREATAPPPTPTVAPPSPVASVVTIRQAGMRNPGALALDASDNLYVASTGSGEIFKFAGDGRFLLKWGTPGRGAGEFAFTLGPVNAGIAVDRQGTVLVTDPANRVQRFDQNGKFLGSWGSAGAADGQLDGPGGIAVDGNDVVYVVDRGNDRIQRFDAAGRFLGKWGHAGAGDGEFDAPSYLALDRQGHAYVTEFNNNRVQKFEPAAHSSRSGGAVVQGMMH